MMRQWSLLLLLLLAPVASGFAQDECVSEADLDWLQGHWRATAGETVFLEQWERNPDGSMSGRAKALSADTGEMYQNEALGLERRAGVLHYLMGVGVSGTPLAFALVGCEDGILRFENEAADFPQRIEYQQLDGQSFNAKLLDLEDQGFELTFTRETAPPCDTEAYPESPPAGSC